MTGYKCETVTPYGDGNSKTEQVEKMFDSIASDYDKMNRLMSLGQDKTWRTKAIAKIEKEKPQSVLDLATGTGDFAIEVYNKIRPSRLVGADLSENMLEIGRKKITDLGISKYVDMVKADSMSLPFNDGEFDAVTIAFGVRNFEYLEKGIKEINRVTSENGSLVILELSVPKNPFYKIGYSIYTKIVIPILAKIVGTKGDAYSYLPQSIESFPEGEVMGGLLKKCGYKTVEIERYTMQTCTMYFAKK